MGRAALDLKGLKVGKLTVTNKLRSREKGHVLWSCLCECGNKVEVRAGHLKAALKKSCGCIREQHRMSTKPEYISWGHMIQRCINPKDKRYQRYGGRGIKVYEKWRKSFSAFYEDMGPRPSPEHSIDRIDNNGDYEPSNCRWATREQQARNTSRTVLIEYKEEENTLKEWSVKLGISYEILSSRLKKKWSVERAFTQAIRKSPRRSKK